MKKIEERIKDEEEGEMVEESLPFSWVLEPQDCLKSDGMSWNKAVNENVF